MQPCPPQLPQSRPCPPASLGQTTLLPSASPSWHPALAQACPQLKVLLKCPLGSLLNDPGQSEVPQVPCLIITSGTAPPVTAACPPPTPGSGPLRARTPRQASRGSRGLRQTRIHVVEGGQVEGLTGGGTDG